MHYSKNNLKFGHEMIEPIASMSWRIRWSVSCVSSRHQYNEEEGSEEYKDDQDARSDSNIGQIGIDHMASMSWRQRWCEL